MATKGSLLYGDMSGGSTDSKGASEFIAKLLHGVTMAHMHHLMVTGPGSFSKHMALGDLYDGLQEAADGLAEAFIGCTGSPLSFSGGNFEMGSDPIADVQKLYDYVETSRMKMGSESHIQNEVDAVCTLLSTALYKLKRLS